MLLFCTSKKIKLIFRPAEHPLAGTPNLRSCPPTPLHGKRKILGSHSLTTTPELHLFNKKNRRSASVSVIDDLTDSLKTPYCDKELLPMNTLFENVVQYCPFTGFSMNSDKLSSPLRE